MATFTVSTASDVIDPNDGRLSLREAVDLANATTAADTIVFASALEGQTLVLTGGELVISRDLTIDGDQDNNGTRVSISGGDTSRILRADGSGTDLALQDLTLTDGMAGDAVGGGGIFVGYGSSLNLSGCTISDCVGGSGYDVPGDGGAIFADFSSQVTIVNSTIGSNSTGYYGDGGGIFTKQGVALLIRGSQIIENIGGKYSSGGGISLGGNSSLTIEDSILRARLNIQ